jgi:hypothetical protein
VLEKRLQATKFINEAKLEIMSKLRFTLKHSQGDARRFSAPLLQHRHHFHPSSHAAHAMRAKITGNKYNQSHSLSRSDVTQPFELANH